MATVAVPTATTARCEDQALALVFLRKCRMRASCSARWQVFVYCSWFGVSPPRLEEPLRRKPMSTHTAPEPLTSRVHLTSAFARELEERFIRYARIDTQSDEKSGTSPSTEKQYELL